MLVTLLMMSFAYGETTSRYIKVILNKVNIAVEGQVVEFAGFDYTLENGNEVPYSILYEGTTYLPIRKVSQLLGKDLVWDGVTQTANIVDYVEGKDSEDDFVESVNLPSADDIEILNQYRIIDDVVGVTRNYVVLKNKSNYTMDITVSGLAYDADDQILGANNRDLYTLGPGCTYVVGLFYRIDGVMARDDITIRAIPARIFQFDNQDLDVEQTSIKEGAIFKVTNISDDVVEFVEGYALFIKNGKLVYIEGAYFSGLNIRSDLNYSLQPDKSYSKQFNYHGDYDNIEFYVTGRKK